MQTALIVLAGGYLAYVLLMRQPEPEPIHLTYTLPREPLLPPNGKEVQYEDYSNLELDNPDALYAHEQIRNEGLIEHALENHPVYAHASFL